MFISENGQGNQLGQLFKPWIITMIIVEISKKNKIYYQNENLKHLYVFTEYAKMVNVLWYYDCILTF